MADQLLYEVLVKAAAGVILLVVEYIDYKFWVVTCKARYHEEEQIKLRREFKEVGRDAGTQMSKRRFTTAPQEM